MQIKRLLISLTFGLGMTLTSLWLLAAGSMTLVYADTYTVTNTNPSGPGSLRQAIIDANSNAGHDTIDFGITGTIVLTGALPAIGDDLTITGPGVEQLAVSGANAHRVFSITTGVAVTITAVTVRDGNADYGGGIWSAGDLYLGAARILRNSASYTGGGVEIWSGSAMLDGTQVVRNSSGSGGGMYVWEGSATLSGTQVISNSARSNGGGVHIWSGSVTLNGTQVADNSASNGGGGVYIYDGIATLNVSGGVIISNSADFGGGMLIWSASVTLSGTEVISNSASTDGGGLYVNYPDATLSVRGGSIDSNSASSRGGGMLIWSASVTLTRTQVISNSASTDGGGLYVNYGSAMLSGVQIVSNTATNHGGGVYVNQGSATLNETQMYSNSVASDGGGVYVDSGNVMLSETQVYSNSASRGGGMYVYQGNATLSGTQIYDNSAYDSVNYLGGNGGGIVGGHNGNIILNRVHLYGNSASNTILYNDVGGNGGGVYGTNMTLNETYIYDNSASRSGGGVFIYGGSAILNDTQVYDNSANRGGGVSVDEGSATLSGTQVYSNSSSYVGGGVYVDQGSVILSRMQVYSNSASINGGGVYVYQGSATLNMTQVYSNLATSGGGMHVLRGNVVLSKTQVVNNSATAHGGGIYVYEGSATLNEIQMYKNSAHYGGGVCVGDGSVTLSRTQVYSNSASSGAGVYVSSGSAILSEIQIYGNSASSYGGGVYVYEDSATLNVNKGEIHNNSAGSGGGAAVYQGSITLSETQVFSNSAYWGGGVYLREGSAMLRVSGGRIDSNLALFGGGGMYISSGSASTMLSKTQIAANDAPAGSALHTGGTITSITALTITGDIYQGAGYFTGSDHDLRIEGSLVLAGGDFYAPDAPNELTLTGLYTHTGGTYHQTQIVNGSGDVGFPKVGGLILNANGQDLDSTEVADTAGADCTGVTVGEAVTHCYMITPTIAAGRDATITFYYSDSEIPGGQSCAAMETYRWNATWNNLLTRDSSYGTSGRMCGTDPLSIQVKDVTTFSPFVLRGLLAPEIMVAPLDLAFSEQDVDAGPTVFQTVTITNNGTADLYISVVIPTGDTSEFILIDSGETTLIPGNIRTIEASFDPSSVGGKVVTLTIQSDDADEPMVDVILSGTGTSVSGQPGYGSDPAPGSSIDVGTTSVGSTISTTLTISETGEVTLMVTPTLSGPDAADFGFAPTTLTILDGGAAQDLIIYCTPSFTGTLVRTMTATLTMVHNALGGPTIYPLSCSSEALTYVYLPLVLKNN